MSENPYESPRSKSDVDKPSGWSPRRITLFIFIILLAIPAALSAAFTLCGIAVMVTASTNIGGYGTLYAVGLTVGTITGISIFVLIVRSAIKKFGPRMSEESHARSEVASDAEIRANLNQEH